MDLNIKDFREHCVMLSKFASIRDGAPPPTDRILVQLDRGLKFVAGDETSTVIVDTGVASLKRGKALVSARTLLQAAKTLRGRGTVDLDLDGKGGMTLTTNTGGKVVLPKVGNQVPGWVRPSDASATAIVFEVPARFWPDLADLVNLGPYKYHWPYDHVHFVAEGGHLLLIWEDGYRWIEATLGGTQFADGYVGSVPADYVKALKAFDGPTGMILSEDRVTVHAGASSALSMLRIARDRDGQPARIAKAPCWYDLDLKATATAERRQVIDAVKAVAHLDKFERMQLGIEAGTLVAHAFNPADGSMSVPAQTTGKGRVGVGAELLGKLLNGLPGKTVTVGLPSRDAGAVKLGEEVWGWRVLLAPVAL